MNLIHEKWDETERGAGNPSRIKAALEKKFFFVVFQCGDDPNDIDAMWLKKVMFWNMPTKDFVEVKKVWQETIKRIKSGKADKLPRLTENNVAHVRPHAKNGSDKIETPHNGLQVKKSFWLNKRYIGQIIKN
jgi:DNA mismatch repair protein MutH